MSVPDNENTRVICRGITGSHGVFQTEHSITYGTTMAGRIAGSSTAASRNRRGGKGLA
jgi:succinyl-CoA synthetase alpha subunit